MCMSYLPQQPFQTLNRFIHKTMSIGIGDNFNYQGSKFNMDRDSFQTKEAMKSYPETSLPPKGFRAYCAENDEYYEFNAENSVDPETGKWRMVDNPTAKKTVEDAKTNGDYAKEQGDAAKEAARKVTNDVLFKVFQSLTEEEQTQVKQNIGIGVEQKFQGQFESYSELEGVSSPAVGDYAYVGNPRNLYAYKSSGWANLGAFNYNIDQELDADSERGIANGVVTKGIASIEEKIGFNEYPTFSEKVSYQAGNVVNYNGKLYKFTANHAAGAWIGTDAVETDVVKAHIAQDTGDDENAVMSQKATSDKFTELESEKLDKSYTSESKIKDTSGGFFFCDKDGNVIAIIKSDGIQAIKFLDKSGNEIVSVTKDVIESLIGGKAVNETDVTALIKINTENIGVFDKKDDGFYFTDKNHNVIAKITSEGIQGIKFLDKDGNEVGTSNISGENGVVPIIENNKLVPSARKIHPLYGKDIYSFGNRLCKGTWEQMLADITGAKFNKEANNLTSWGGTFSGDIGGPLYNEEGYGKNGDMPGGIRRAKNFVMMPKETYGNKDVVFFENVHDTVSENENISDSTPFMWTRYAIYENKEFSGSNAQNDANSFFNENITSVLTEVGFTEPKVGSMVKLKIKSITIPLIFTNGATSTGSVKITINGTDFETEVSEGDSIEQVIDKISVWSFSDSTGWKNVKKDNTTINLQYVGGNNSTENDVITFDAQNTGVIASTQEKTESISYRTHAFMSLDVTDWTNSSHWSYYSSSNKMFNVWKGIIEYIQKNCPDTKMYMCLFPNSIYKKSDVRADGSFDVEAFYNSSQWKEHLKNRRCLTEVADYYNIPIIDLEKEMCVMSNWETYFPENNVHMKSNLYKRFAEIIASKVY